MRKTRSTLLFRVVMIILVFATLFSVIPLFSFAINDKASAFEQGSEISVPISTEITTQRGEFEKHFLLADGSFIAVSYAEAIHYKNSNNEWTEVDNQLSENSDGRINNNYEDFAVSFGASAADARLVSIEKNDKEFTWSLAVKGEFTSAEKQIPSNTTKAVFSNKTAEETTFSGKTIKDVETLMISKASGTISYNSLFMEAPEISAKYTVFHNKVEEDIIISAPTKVREFILTVRNAGLIATLCEDGAVEFCDIDGNALYTICSPYMCDANDEVLHDIRVIIESAGDTTEITYIPNAQWLSSKERAYPILLDPSITTSEYNSNIVDTYVAQDDTTNHSTEQKLYYGVKNGKIHRVYIKINNLPNIDATMPITNAQMQMTFTTGTSSGKTACVYKVSGEWFPATITYNNQPSFNSTNLLDTCDFTTGCLIFNLTNDFSNMYSEYFACMSDGYMIRYADESNVNPDYNAFRSMEYTSNTSHRPLFTISYGYALPSTLTNGSVYSFLNYGSGSYMTVHDGLDANGTNVYQQYVASINDLALKHKFQLEYVSTSGGYRLKAMCSANQYRTLDIVKTDGFVEDGGNVQIYKPTDDLAQHWYIVGMGDCTFKLIPRTNMSLALTVFPSLSNGTASGTMSTSAGNIFVSEYDDANPYQLWQIMDSAGTMVPFSPLSLPSGTYYLNNSFYGEYLKNTASGVNASSGLMDDLGNLIKWVIIHQGNGRYTIQPQNDLTKYLCMTSSSTLSLSTLPGSGLTDYYLWMFENPYQTGGKHIRNAATSKYLYEYSNIGISILTGNGAYGSDLRKKCTWRVAKTDYYGNTSNHAVLELPNDYLINLLPLLENEQSYPIIDPFPRAETDTNVLWAGTNDFEYTILTGASFIERIGNDRFKGIDCGKALIKAHHKPTGVEKEFYICVCQYSMTVHIFYDNGFIKRNINGETTVNTMKKSLKRVTDFAGQVYAYNVGVKIIVDFPELFASTADTCTGYSDVSQLNEQCTCSDCSQGTDNSTDTTHTNNRVILNDFKNSHTANDQEKYYYWTGHYTWEWNAVKRDGVVILERNPMYNGAFTNNGEYVMMLNKDFSDNPLDSTGIYYTVIHEMGHLLGLPDSYCTKKVGVPCDSPNCPEHGIYGEDGPLGENGFGRYCVMANRSYVESHMFTDFSSFDFEEYPILCPHCLDIAQDWANGHLGS